MQTEEMNNFLKNCAKIYIQNPNIAVSSDTIYDRLRNYGLERDEFRHLIPDQISTLENNFRKSKNLLVYTHPGMPSFLQFLSTGTPDEKCAKLYLSVKKEYVGYVTERIFRFIERKKIASNSKVAKCIRADQIVLRVPCDDVPRILDFINKDKSFTDLIRYNNPFEFRCGKVGMAYDDELSYNLVISGFIATYLEQAKASNRLANVSLADFVTFYNKYYQDVFVNGSRLREYTGTRNYVALRSRVEDVGEYINNHAEVATLFYMHINNRLNNYAYYGFLENCNDLQKTNENAKRYKSMLQNPEQQYAQANAIMLEVKKLLDEYIIHSINKSQNPNAVVSSLEGFLHTNEPYITRENNFRTRFAAIDKKWFAAIMKNGTANYVENLVKDFSKTTNDPQMYELFHSAMIATGKKYGRKHLSFALHNMLEGVFSSVTNDSEFRQKLYSKKEYFSRERIMQFCKSYLTNLGYNLNRVNDIIDLYTLHLESMYSDEMEQRII